MGKAFPKTDDEERCAGWYLANEMSIAERSDRA
jgi:hypothetical protein